MTARPSRDQRPAPLPVSLLRSPLDYLLAEHHRHRVLCRLCDDMAGGVAFDATIAREVAASLETDLALHILDEEEDLFPLLRRRANPEDGIESILALLSRDHVRDGASASAIVARLRRLAGRRRPQPSAPLRRRLAAFARDQRKHLALENAIVMPLARVRLSRRDLDQLYRSMAARRGIAVPV